MTAISNSITIERPPNYVYYPSFIEVVNIPTYASTLEEFSMKFIIYDNEGSPIKDSPVLIDFKYVSDTVTQFPELVFPNLKSEWKI